VKDSPERRLDHWQDQLRPLYVRELSIFQRQIPDERLPAWKAIFAALILRLEIVISAQDNGPQALAGIELDPLLDEIRELRAYIYAVVPGYEAFVEAGKLRDDHTRALHQIGDGLVRAGYSYSETSVILEEAEKAKSKGATASRRNKDVDAYEMKQRGLKYNQIAADFGDCFHGAKDRVRKGIKTIEKLLRRLEQSRPQRETELQQLRLPLAERPASHS
jgi:hypothetical protein